MVVLVGERRRLRARIDLDLGARANSGAARRPGAVVEDRDRAIGLDERVVLESGADPLAELEGRSLPPSSHRIAGGTIDLETIEVFRIERAAPAAMA